MVIVPDSARRFPPVSPSSSRRRLTLAWRVLRNYSCASTACGVVYIVDDVAYYRLGT